MAGVLTKKAQVVLTEAEYDLLRCHGRSIGKSVSELVREHLQQTLIRDLDRARRLAAVERMSKMEALPFDHEKWEEEYNNMYLDDPLGR